jgi:hypothetical protein
VSAPFLPDPAVSAGLSAFDAGEVAAATASWSASPSWAAAYDRGTVALLAGDAPSAVAALRSAALRAPRREDVGHNLALARSAVVGAPPPVPLPGVPVTPAELGACAALAAVGFSLAAVRGRPASRVASWLAAAGLLGASSLWLADQPVVVVVVAEAAVREEPHPLARPDDDPLVPGAEVEALGPARDGFLPVRDGAGRAGWIPADAVITSR